MTKRTRTILFSTCIVLFLIIAPSMVLYSQGYRFDFDSRKIVQTGGLFFKVWPKSAKIYLDGKLKKKTDFLFGSALIENLLPGKYEIQIKKEGFHLWKKTLEVREKQVTELKNVFLIPENPTFNVLAKNVDYFWVSPDKKKIIFKGIGENGWALKILELETGVITHLFDEKDFKKEKGAGVEILDLKYSPDSKKILLKIEEDKEEKYFISSIEEAPANLIPLDFLDSNPPTTPRSQPTHPKKGEREISFNPGNPQKIFFSRGDKLFEADFLKKEKRQILENLITSEISDKNIFFVSDEGFLFKTDLSGVIQERLNSEPFVLKNEAQYQIHLKGKDIFLLENDVVYFLNKDSEKFEKLFEGIENLEISPDFKKIVYFSDHEIWILFLEEILDQPQKKAGEKLFLTRFSEKIDKVFWYTSHYLIFNVGNNIKVAEVDDRDRINIVDLAEFKEPKIFFNEVGKKLYVLDGRNLFVSKKLLP